MGYFVGIDVGTTGTKAVLIDEQGELRAKAVAEYEMHSPAPHWAEQNPEDWWHATQTTVREVIREAGIPAREIAGLGLSGQMHGSVFLDSNGQVLRPAILWCDQRTDQECVEITERVGPERLLELTCNPALTGFTAPKIVWLRNHQPELFEKTSKVLLPKDYVRWRLTGEFATDVSDASGTLLFDVRNRSWSKPMLELLGIPGEWMPDCFESPEVTGTIHAEAAEATGLVPGTPVVAGAGDQAGGAVGTGIVRAGVISSTLGTSGVIFAFSERPEMDPKGRLHTFCHAVPGKWHLMGVTLAAGGSFRWLRDTLCLEEVKQAEDEDVDPYEIMTRAAAAAPAGSAGLIFLPYLIGERTPYPDPYARGVWLGLTLLHQKIHLIRSVMEGVTFSLRDCLELMRDLGVPIREIRGSGGGNRSQLWRQIQADVFNAALRTTHMDEGPAFGAALLAGVGTGAWASVEEACDATIRITSEVKPVPEHVSAYGRLYQTYRQLYPLLKDRFRELGAVGNS
jgi:xylulokinase